MQERLNFLLLYYFQGEPHANSAFSDVALILLRGKEGVDASKLFTVSCILCTKCPLNKSELNKCTAGTLYTAITFLRPAGHMQNSMDLSWLLSYSFQAFL
jgi:hypothetical protein